MFDLDKATFLYVRGNEKNPDTAHPMLPAVPAALHGPKYEVRPVRLPADVAHPILSSFIQSDDLTPLQAACKRAARGLARAQKESADAATCELARLRLTAAQSALTALEARIVAEEDPDSRTPVGARAPNRTAAAGGRTSRRIAVGRGGCRRERARANAEPSCFVASARWAPKAKSRARRAGNPAQQLAAAEKRLATARENAKKKDDQFTPLGPSFPSTSTGRRLALARWIASDENPLTARVAVNHIWLRHFGQPLVPTVFDFGLHGKPATHPELLDWLAIELMRSNWNMKRLHRLIVLSETYGRDSAVHDPQSQAARLDPDNLISSGG